MKNRTNLVQTSFVRKLTFNLYFILIVSSGNIYAQEGDSPNFKFSYWSVGYEFNGALPKNHSNKLALLHGLRTSVYFNDEFLISASFKSSRTFKSDNFPSNFSGGFQPLSTGVASEDKIQVLTFGFGKMLNPKTKLLRFTFEGGLSWIQYAEANYTKTEPPQTITVASASHRIDYPDKESGVGLNLKSKIELNWARFGGSFWLIEGNINTIQSYFSIGAGIHFGKIRQRT